MRTLPHPLTPSPLSASRLQRCAGTLLRLAAVFWHWRSLKQMRRLLGTLLVVFGSLAAWPALAEAATSAVQLGAHTQQVAVWPHARLLLDPDTHASADNLARNDRGFTALSGQGDNLGQRRGAVWLRFEVAVAPDADDRWVLDVDYASIDRIDVWLLEGGQIRQQVHMGDHVPQAQRPLASRSHAVDLRLAPGSRTEVLMRVETVGSMILPITLSTPAHYQEREAREQALQGLVAGMGLCLLIYSLTQWVALRDAMFGYYALTLLGTTAFFSALSGVGAQHVWGGNEWLTRNAAPFTILLGVCGAFLFVLRALEVAQWMPRVARLVSIGAGIAGLTAAAFLVGLIDYRTAQTIGMALGPAPLLLVLPTAWRRLRRGDHTAAYILIGWGFYSVGVLVIVGLLRGWVPVGFWSLHAFQFASMIEMAMWMLVLGDRVQQMRHGAVAVSIERDRMRSLASTDALTGLLNRRGLQSALPTLLTVAGDARMVAVFVLDLDGFKPVNDRHGHDVGDALLRQVAQRLRALMRDSDVVCRLGGDEFVLAAGGLSGDADASRIGQKILKGFEAPFDVDGVRCDIGVTIGYALAPLDGMSADVLIKQADTAMYAGKQAGKRRVQRCDGAIGAATVTP